MSGDVSTIDEEPIGIEAFSSMTELPDDSHLQLAGEDVLYDGLIVEEQLEAHVEIVMEEDAQLPLGLDINKGQRREHTLGFQHSLPQRHVDGVYNIIISPLCIGLREAELFRQIIGDDQVNKGQYLELSMAQRQHGGLVPYTRDCTFYPSFGIGW